MGGPQTRISKEIGEQKHYPNETFEEACNRWAKTLADDKEHERRLFDMFSEQRVLLAGRVQRAAGHFHDVTAFNCFVSGTIPDSMQGIMQRATEAAITMQKGGGIGYDFGTLRPKGAEVTTTGSHSSGPVSFMNIFDSVCSTVKSAGGRRGAQMAVLPVWHPDIRDFINAKKDNSTLTNFNISVGVTDEFMEAVINDRVFELRFGSRLWETVPARDLWDEIMANTWDWAEPGVVFIDRINEMNNLWYIEDIEATNPCAEQPLPPHGACLLASINWVKYLNKSKSGYIFDVTQFSKDIPNLVRALDNVIDKTIYPLEAQEIEAKQKRRMGIGCTGVANTLEALGYSYGSVDSAKMLEALLSLQTNWIYEASADLAKEKGPFPLFSVSEYTQGAFIQRLDRKTQDKIRTQGIRNSHLTSIAPTGTISLAADNVSSGIEPPYQLSYNRKIADGDGSITEKVEDYGRKFLGITGRTADQLTPEEHIRMLLSAQKWTDSSVSKTCNIGPNTTFDEFKEVYMMAYKGGAKGCTTFRSAGKRFGILSSMEDDASCTVDPETGIKTCE